ncbi:protein-glutamate methylesterase/protein-glutamine glutaminase [Leptospira sp. GIMC2001]|uniref:protein-glutamate methylesterase/protein-glutamine glutaminase n=1 Tax=Leptospira sp. GIMC2001 TaxID=1513297 RepID=UPI00234AA1CA|nr:chemotaxis response regulator protein-glutamate methylesterase [Leptospira sp. GIMC2001]WCL48902.1 chemotaxis response regulator protein-glutamate methylesterase [Leptospira sp. GIMC2001]
MSKRPIKVLIVDDSLLVRNIIADILTNEDDIEVVATGKTGVDCVELSKKLNPDLIVLDIEMPVMDGLSALSELKKNRLRIPTIMLSVLTQHGADATFRALELGAIDFIPKPSSQIQMDTKELGRILIQRIRGYFDGSGSTPNAKESTKTSSTEKIVRTFPEKTAVDKKLGTTRIAEYEVICFGTSTGGPKALQTIVQAFPGDLKIPVFIVQHMPAGFTKAFADRMNGFCKLHVKEAENGEPVVPGTVYIAPGDFHMKISNKSGAKFIELDKSPVVNGHRPSIEMTFDSLREVYGGHKIVATIMTGMGRDGADAIKRIHDAKGFTLAQDESSSVIYGMNKYAVEIGAIDRVKPLVEILPNVLDIVNQRG